MFRAILETQWKWTRGVALFATLVMFAIPLASLAVARSSDARSFVAIMQSAGVAYGLAAAAIGLAVAAAAWTHDHRGRHVYALSLPITRPRYALLRLGAGAVFLAPPILGLLLGAQIVAFSGAIPGGLHAYPLMLTIRFAFAAGVAYSIFFAISSSTPRTAGAILGVIAAFGLIQYVAVVSYNTEFAAMTASIVGKWLFGKAGVLSVFAGRWMLVDA